MKGKLISCALAAVTAFTFGASSKKITSISVYAASKEEFLSEVGLVYRDTYEEAQEAVKGTDWKVLDEDLNPDADYMFNDGVYLIYKTSTNVEDAITDLRVMDMYGGYNTTNYKQQLKKSHDKYGEKIDELRVAVNEFKEKYEANDGMAQLAYRQMNYYKDVKTTDGTETDMLMGEFFLNLPADDVAGNNQIIQVLLEGNAIIVSNLLSLLAVGISGAGDAALSAKIADKYANKDTLSDREYYDSASALVSSFETIRAKLLCYDALKGEYELEDENMTDEEYTFVSEYATLAELLTTIPYGEKQTADGAAEKQTLADFIKGAWETKDLYPVVAAFTPGQKALAEMGQLESVLKYNTPSKPIDELTATVEEIEEAMKDENGKITPIDVYEGVDRELFKGDFAMTDAAERQQALTGETWGIDDAADRSLGMIVGYVVAGAVDLAMAGAAVGIAIKASTLKAAAATVVVPSISTIMVNGKAATVGGALVYKQTMVTIHNYAAEKAYAGFMAKWGALQTPLIVTTVALALILAGGYAIATWYNYYNPKYLEIPTTLVDVRETDLGDRYVKYTAAKVHNGEEGQEVADFNAYEGKEWIALYYTKDANAGNCLTPNFVPRDNTSAVAKRHQGISMFGEDVAFNLNSHAYDKDAPGVYLSVRYSTTKKAAADMPAVVGSMITTAHYILTAIGGVGVGAGGMALFQNLKNKKKDEEIVAEEETTTGE